MKIKRPKSCQVNRLVLYKYSLFQCVAAASPQLYHFIPKWQELIRDEGQSDLLEKIVQDNILH